MNDPLGQTWEQELLALGEARGEARGRLQGRLEVSRDSLLTLLEDRFGPLPVALVQRIYRSTDLEKLRACVRQTIHLRTLDELNL
jgi:hypothetical protein